MLTSIQDFLENGTKTIEKIINDFGEQENANIADLIIELDKPIQELQRKIVEETIEDYDDLIRKSITRKEKWSIIRSGDKGSFMSTCGEIVYSKTYYISKELKGSAYLVDRFIGITPHARISDDVVINIIENAIDTSYNSSGKLATKTDDIISRQSVMKQIHEVEIPKQIIVKEEKKKVKNLYIDADEDHVSLQFRNKKGDLKKDDYGRKNNTIMPMLVYVYEGSRKVSPSSKRYELYGKHHFGGVYSNSEVLWDEVSEYIDSTYDTDYLEKIFILGDGASWIKTGVDILGSKTLFVLDKYHLNKYIVSATSHLEDRELVGTMRQRIYDSFSFEDKKEIKKIFKEILSLTLKKSKRKSVIRSEKYILNQWDGIIIKNDPSVGEIGCSAESHISHILSDRLSSRPLGWSALGVDKMSRLRVYKANGGNVYDLVMYKQAKEKIEIEEEIKRNIDILIKEKRKKCNDCFNTEIPALSMGKKDGLQISLKSLRGICG